MTQKYEALVVLGAHLNADGSLSDEALQRTIAGVEQLDAGVAPYLVMSGNRPFRQEDRALPPVADTMREYAVGTLGAPADAVLSQAKSLDTIGDAIYTKQDVIAARGWQHIGIMSNQSHLARATDIFRHVMGSLYTVGAISAGSYEKQRGRQLSQELAGTLLARMVLSGTMAGDDEDIKRRLHEIIPGYAPLTKRQRMAAILKASPRALHPFV